MREQCLTSHWTHTGHSGDGSVQAINALLPTPYSQQHKKYTDALTHKNLTLQTQLAQLSHTDRAAGWVSFGWVVGDGVGQTILCTIVSVRKLKALIFYTINPLLYEKRSLCIMNPSLEGLGATYAVHLRLIRKPIGLSISGN